MGLFRKAKIFSHEVPILVNSIPKSGTNLLLNAVKSIPGTIRGGDFSYAQRHVESERLKYLLSRVKKLDKGTYYPGHVPYSVEIDQWLLKNDFLQIFIYRDPRDVVISSYYFILEMKKENHLHYKVLTELGENEDKLLDLIMGIGEGKNDLVMNESSLAGIRFMYERYENWLNHPKVLGIRYEDFIQNPSIEIERILKFLNFTKKEELKLIAFIQQNGMNPQKSHTFRKGKLESWKSEFTKERMDAFNEYFPVELLNKYGYHK